MVLTIGPAVRGVGGRQLLVVHTAGLFLGATAMACVTTVAGAALPHPGSAEPLLVPLTSCVLVLWALRAGTGRGLPFPSSKWQVPAVWRYTLPFATTLFAYGVLLGLGFLTAVVSPLYWCLLVGSLVSHSFAANLTAWAIYAGARAASTWAGSVHRYVPPGTQGMPEAFHPPHWRAARVASTASLIALAIWLVI